MIDCRLRKLLNCLIWSTASDDDWRNVRFRCRSCIFNLTLQLNVGQLQLTCFTACIVFASSIAIVIGPTPPGTGVIAEAISATGS